MNTNKAAEVRHGADLVKPMMNEALCRVREDGKIVTDSLIIADQFERQHKNVLASLDGLIERGRIGQLDFKPTSYMDQWNRQQRMIELTERGALIAMPFIGGNKSEEGQVRLVDAFEATREELRRVKTEQPRPVASLPNFEDPAAAAEAWALQFRGRAAAESERNQLRLAIAEQAQDVEFVKKYVEADGLLGVRSTCQALDIENERDFVDFMLNALRCMYRLEGALVPRAQHRHAKRFKVKTGIDHDTSRAYTTAKITGKGITWLAREWAEYNLDRSAYIAKHAPKAGEVDEEVEEATREAAERRAAKEAAKAAK
jgi:Rha family phage regulatory protein